MDRPERKQVSTTQRTKKVTLACGCSTKVAPKVIDVWLQPNGGDLLVFCDHGHGQQKITSAEGPAALAALLPLG